MTELSLGVKALAVDDDIEKSEPEKLNILFTFAKKALDKGKKWYANKMPIIFNYLALLSVIKM